MKQIKFLSMLLFLAATATFMSCDKEDNPSDPGNTGGGSTTPKTVNLTYSVGDMRDMTELVDVTVEYNDSTGTKVTEQSVSLPWEKNFKEVKTPVTAKLIVSYKTKEGVTYDKEAYRISRDVRLSVTTPDDKNIYQSSPLNLTISKDKIADYIKEYLENKPDSISVDCK